MSQGFLSSKACILAIRPPKDFRVLLPVCSFCIKELNPGKKKRRTRDPRLKKKKKIKKILLLKRLNPEKVNMQLSM